MKRIVIATDGSDGAGDALEQGFALASELGAKVFVLYVRPGPVSYVGAPSYQAVINEEARRAREVIDDAKVRASRYDVDVEYDVLEGDPVNGVLALARSRDADLIVVGSRGLGTVSSVLLGSVSKAILHRADRPVLVMKPRVLSREPAELAAG